MAKKSTKPPRLETLGPTRETMRHGDYVAPEGRGVLVVFTNRKVDLLSRLQRVGAITKRQASAGERYAKDHEVAWGSSTRDSTQPPIGGISHETESAAERHARARARLHSILNRAGPMGYSLLRQVCVHSEGLGSQRDHVRLYRALVDALDQCAIVYGVSE